MKRKMLLSLAVAVIGVAFSGLALAQECRRACKNVEI
jgi:hypothetical protein